MDASQKRRIFLLGLLTASSIFLFHLLHDDSHARMPLPSPTHPHQYQRPPPSPPGLHAFPSRALNPANATLGFGAVIAVSHAQSPRRKSLLYAANLTGIQVAIPEQPQWTEEDVERFRAEEGRSKITKGSALAWLGHLNALRWFLSTPHETALIVEDDVDWDIALRLSQIPLAAAATRHLLPISNSSTQSNIHSSSSSSLRTLLPAQHPRRSLDYWSPLSTWEILYLGHCGDTLPALSLPSHPHLAYHDPSVPPPSHLHHKTTTLLSTLNIPPSTRLLHKSYNPLCTFAYAVTRSSATRILSAFPTESSGSKHGDGCEAFDVRILEACRDHGWACYTVTPELFHHIEAPSEISQMNQAADPGGGVVAQRRGKRGAGGIGRGGMTTTTNIGCRARHPGFVVEHDAETAGWLKRVVGEQGHCLVDWIEEDRGVDW